ncbi:MAG TPA: hypothetical protein DCZ69_08680, partial [Syntrophobacteraceae bacterium]|nr:hypothetical protein [Syntrophobacteraceae bacterium]
MSRQRTITTGVAIIAVVATIAWLSYAKATTPEVGVGTNQYPPPVSVDAWDGPGTLALSAEEKAWLREHPLLRLGVDPDWAPIEFIDEQGRPSGISSEYLGRLEQILHVKFENPRDMTWAQMMDALKGGLIDMVSCIQDTPQRRQFMDFTDAYVSMPTAIFTRNNVSYADLASLAGKPVAIVEGYAVQGFLADRHPEILLVAVKSLREGLTLLSEGTVYAYIDALAPGSYGLTRYGITNIRATGETPFRYEMAMASSKQAPELAAILQKAIRAISEADRNRFYQKWSNVQISYRPDYPLIWKILAGSGGLVLIFAYWTRRLSAEVSRRRQVETELRHAKEGLEVRVEERTGALEARNVALAEEVLERKRALAALRTSEMQYRSVIENIQDVFYRSDTAGRLLMGSPSGARMFGYDSVDEMLGMPLDSFWPDPMERQQLLAQVRATGSARDYEAVLRRKDGSTFNALFATHFYYDDDGNLLGTEGIIRDVTERKRAEEALRQANLVVENSPVVLFRWRAAEGWPVEMVSRNVSQLGYTPEELLSGAIPFASMVHPEDLDRVAREVREYTATGVDRFQQEYRIITKDGEERWVDDRTQVERDGDGQITHYQGIVIDITERKRAEEALLQEKHFTDTLIDSMPGMFYLFDEQARLARWNKQFEQSTGYDAESISRTSALDFIHPEDRNLVAEKIREVFIHGESHVEGRVVTRHGGTIPFYLTGLRITFGDKTYLLGVGLDISERVRVEAESARLQVLLRSVILQSPVPMVLVLPDGTVELFNEGCRSVLGVPEGLELPPDLNLFTLEKTWIDYSAEGSQLPLAELPLTLALQGKTTRSREMKVLRQDGTERWILVDAVPVVDDHSIVIAGFLIFIDITERKRAEEILHESMRRLQTVVNGAPVVLYSFDRHGVFTLSEGKGLVGLGIKPGEIVGRTIFEVYGDQPASIAALHRAMAGETFTLELSFPAGGTFEASHIAMFNDAGDYNGTIGVLVDITERKRAEEALRESEGRFTQVFQSAPVPMAFASDVDSFRATTWNEAWYQAFGYPREQAEGRSGADIGLWVNPDDRSRFIEMANRQNEVTGFETLMRRHDGAVLHCSLFGRFIGKAGHRLLMAVYLDITERKRA